MFKFKYFEIHDELSAMKIGTDGVLLGAWADVRDARSILDVGTGTGLVAIMCAQRNATASVHGIDIVEAAAREAEQNMSRAAWHERLSAEHDDLRSYNPDVRYDHIVSTPMTGAVRRGRKLPERIKSDLIKSAMISMGANEIATYSFISSKALDNLNLSLVVRNMNLS